LPTLRDLRLFAVLLSYVNRRFRDYEKVQNLVEFCTGCR
jgi:hypothetical protein